MKENIKKTDSVAQSLIDAEKITASIKEDTKNALKSLLSEGVTNFVNETFKDVLKEKDKEDDSYEVEDVEDEDTEKDDAVADADDADMDATDADSAADDADVEADDANAEAADADADAENADMDAADADSAADDADMDADDSEDWSDFDDLKTDNGEYDFTGVDDVEKIAKVYKLMNDDDQVIVSKGEDGKVNVKDNETGAEYVIELDPEVEAEDSAADMDIEEGCIKEENNMGYTDNYQSASAMEVGGMEEPAHKDATYSMDGGVPTGTKKPFAGKGSSAPFDKTVKESYEEDDEDIWMDDESDDVEEGLDEITTVTANNARKMPKTHTSTVRKPYLPKGSKNISAGGEYDANVVESIVKKAKAIQEENKKIKAFIPEMKKRLIEANVINKSLGQIVKLFTENTTTIEEKKDIIARFGKVKSINESKSLYESIKKEISKGAAKEVVIEKTISAAPATAINETTVYQSEGVKSIKNLMNRMGMK